MPRSSRDHSDDVITRGTRSSGNGRSSPDSEKVMPWSTSARSSASDLAFRSPGCSGTSDSCSRLYAGRTPSTGIEHLVVRIGMRPAGIEIPVEQLGTRAG